MADELRLGMNSIHLTEQEEVSAQAAVMKSAGNNTSRISEDLIWEILIRLPAESINRFRKVCKSWRKLIESPSFIKSQVNKTVAAGINTNNIDSRPLFVFHSITEEVDNGNYARCQARKKLDSFVVLRSPGNLKFYFLGKLEYPALIGFAEKKKKSNNPVEIFKKFHRIVRFFPLFSCFRETNQSSDDDEKIVKLVGTCNGLICLRYTTALSDNPLFVLWNPSTRIHRIVCHVPEILSGAKHYRVDCSYFGYDLVKDDYHLIRVTSGYESHDMAVNGGDSLIIIDVYCLRNDSWTRIRTENVWNITVRNGVYISGTLYLDTQRHRNKMILAFDVNTERFCLVDLPQPIHNLIGCQDYILGELHGRLSIRMTEYLYRNNMKDKHVVWLMMMNDDKDVRLGMNLWKKIDFEIQKPAPIKKILGVVNLPGAEEELFMLVLTDFGEIEMAWSPESTTRVSFQRPPVAKWKLWDACVCLTTIASPFIL